MVLVQMALVVQAGHTGFLWLKAAAAGAAETQEQMLLSLLMRQRE